VAYTPSVAKAWVDAGFKDDVAIHCALHGIDVEQIKRSDTSAGVSCRSPSGWPVEQVNGTPMLQRRLIREYEIRLASSESRPWWEATANLSAG
jgi:hypothetical protein